MLFEFVGDIRGKYTVKRMNKVAISGRTTGVEDGDGEALLLSQQRGVTLQS